MANNVIVEKNVSLISKLQHIRGLSVQLQRAVDNLEIIKHRFQCMAEKALLEEQQRLAEKKE
jgi:hypothetical protein